MVDVNNFDDNTWFGENGYFHTDAMHVTERLCGWMPTTTWCGEQLLTIPKF